MPYNSLFAETLKSNYGLNLDISYPLCLSRYVIWGLIFYVTSIIFFQPSNNEIKPKLQRKIIKKKKKFGTTEMVIFLHNLILAIFSICCFIKTAPTVFNLFIQNGFSDGICKFHTIYDNSSFGYWSYLFYLSKYWEFIDSWIVCARGRRPIFLQEYHHVGAVIGMWLITITKSSAGYLFIVQNSFIHTIMYTYYAASVIGYKFPLKNWITIMQMIQFINGIGITAFQLFNNSSCLSYEDILCCIYLEAYVCILFYLFLRFYRKTYAKKKR